MATRVEPLFVRFANGESTTVDVIKALESSEDEKTRQIVSKALENPPDLSVFRTDFKAMLSDLAENGVSRRIINYVDSYMKPSLEEFVDGSGGRAGEKRWVVVKADDAPWPEAVVCYNLCLYLKAYGIKELKKCATCGCFFTNKGRYAKYCMSHTPK
jgi:hypothetical protein